MKQNKTERQKRLIAMISADSAILIRDLALALGVSRETVRRDFDALSKEGKLHRRYGGGTFVPIGMEMKFNKRSELFVVERIAIAQSACSRISNNEVILLGSGATCIPFASELVNQGKEVVVITNNIPAALVLGKSRLIRTLLTPGEYDSLEGFVWGHETTEFINKFSVDIVVFSAEGISSSGVMEIDSRTSWILRAMIRRARRKLFLADSNKYHQTSLELVCRLDEVDVIVSDKQPDEALRLILQRSGVIIDVASPELRDNTNVAV